MIKRLCIFLLIASLFGLMGTGCKKSDSVKPNPSIADGGSNSSALNQPDSELDNLTEDQKRIRATTQSEELVLSLVEQMSLLNRSFQDRSIDLSGVAEELSYSGVGIGDNGKENGKVDFKRLLSAATVSAALQGGLAGRWKKTATESKGGVELIAANKIWASILGDSEFESCQFGTVGSRFVGEDFETDTKFEGRFRDSMNRLIGVLAHQTLHWSEVSPGSWRIKKWNQKDFEIQVAQDSLFEDATDSAIPDLATRQKVQSSSIERMMLKNSKIAGKKGMNPPSRKHKDHADWESSYQYPAVSVVDIDQDGFDDLFVTDRWQPAQLLRNQGDGTFEDITQASGLNVERLSCCAFFADFDNDGDSDVFVGGTLEPCQYFENVDGKFQLDESLLEEYKDLVLVVSGAVADVNRAGLLDIYLSTYGIGTGWHSDQKNAWSDTIIRVEDRLKMRLKVERSHWYVDRGGPPNVLLLNDGGKLKRAKIGDELVQWRNSYQSVWADFDTDGDPDLYICNDFAPDCFLRNDTQQGSMTPKFVVATEELVPDGTMCFGMGSHCGDFNNDGLLDLYVSNMYSKAGGRVLANFPDADERIKVSARGNFLYQNQGGTFKQVAGLESGSQHVSKVGWSFGGQFADFDNDGHLDLYVPSGFFTPPEEIQKPGEW